MIKEMGSRELLDHTKNLAREERRVTAALVESLAEIDRRRLYADLNYSSLWEYVVKELGLSESSTQRRIQAARLLLDAPVVKAALEEGTLSLSNAAKVQSFRQQEKKQGRKYEAGALVAAMESLSQRECEQKLLDISPAAIPKEKDRTVSAKGDRELKFVVSAETYDKLQKIKGMIAHAKPEASFAELFEYLASEQLARLEKKAGIGLEVESTRTVAAEVTRRKPLPSGKRVYIPVAIKRAVGARSGGQCERVHEGKRCSSRYRLQLDHLVPLSLGGANELGNLRHLCRTHNLQQARQKLGGVRQRYALTPEKLKNRQKRNELETIPR